MLQKLEDLYSQRLRKKALRIIKTPKNKLLPGLQPPERDSFLPQAISIRRDFIVFKDHLLTHMAPYDKC